MLKIKDDVKIEELKKYGFKREPEGSYFYYPNNECEIFIWKSNKDKYYIPKGIYIEAKDNEIILSELDALYDLIKDGLVEKV